MKAQHVYFIKPVGMDGPIKIGCTAGISNRLQQLAGWSPFDLEVAAILPGGRELEERFQAYFIDSHHRQEWFHPSDRMTAVIEAINAGTFDTSILPASLGMIRVAARMKGKETPEEWEYRQKYSAALRARHRSDRWPTAPCVFKQYGRARREQEMAHLDGILSRAARPSTSPSSDIAA